MRAVVTLLALCVACVAATGVTSLASDETDDVLRDRVKTLQAEIKELKFLLATLDSDFGPAIPPVTSAPARSNAAGIDGEPETVEVQAKPFPRAHERRLATGNGSAAALTFQHPGARFAFAQGSQLYDTNGTLVDTGSLIITQNLTVQGSLTVGGSNLNLGIPLIAATPITAGSIVSLTSNGLAASGFGMQVSSAVTTMATVQNAIVLNMTSTITVVLYNDTNSCGQAVFFDTTGSSPTSPVAISGTDVLWDMTATRVSSSTFVVCYRRVSASPGRCVVGTVNIASQAVNFGSAYDVYQSSTYINGVVTNLFDATDRVVLAFSVASPESSRFAVMGVTGLSISLVTPSDLPQFEYSAMTDNFAAVALTRTNILLAYRLPRDQQGYLRKLYFNAGDNVNIFNSVSVPMVNPNSPLQYLQLTRLNSTFAVVLYRDPNANRQIYAALVDNSGFLPVMLPPVLINTGTQNLAGLGVGIASVQPDRLAILFTDANQIPYVQDCGVSGSSLVLGRSQQIFRGTSLTATALAITATSGNTVMMVTQQNWTSTNLRGANMFIGTFYGAPIMVGFATNTVGAGGSVTVALGGAVSGFSGLSTGALYYAGYNGGLATSVNEATGVSSVVVGVAASPDTVNTLLNTDGPQVMAGLNTLTNQLATLSVTINAVNSRILRLENAFRSTHWFNNTLPVYYWAMFSTYSQNGGWYSQNDASQYLGVNPSNWGDNSYSLIHMASDKEQWRTLMNKRGYGGKNAVIYSEEWYYYSSTNSRHVVAMFRISNPTSAAITWVPYFYYTCYGGWSNTASVTLNGANTWSTTGTCQMCTQSLSLSLPANRISTIFFSSSGGGPSSTQTDFLAFYSNSLQLPNGLTYVDDIHTSQGGFST